MGRMPYTFVNVQADVKFEMSFQKSCDVASLDTILLDREGRVIYGKYPNSVAAAQRFSLSLIHIYTVFPSSTEAVQRTARVLKALLAHEARKQSPDVHPAQ